MSLAVQFWIAVVWQVPSLAQHTCIVFTLKHKKIFANSQPCWVHVMVKYITLSQFTIVSCTRPCGVKVGRSSEWASRHLICTLILYNYDVSFPPKTITDMLCRDFSSTLKHEHQVLLYKEKDCFSLCQVQVRKCMHACVHGIAYPHAASHAFSRAHTHTHARTQCNK